MLPYIAYMDPMGSGIYHCILTIVNGFILLVRFT